MGRVGRLPKTFFFGVELWTGVTSLGGGAGCELVLCRIAGKHTISGRSSRPFFGRGWIGKSGKVGFMRRMEGNTTVFLDGCLGPLFSRVTWWRLYCGSVQEEHAVAPLADV